MQWIDDGFEVFWRSFFACCSFFAGFFCQMQLMGSLALALQKRPSTMKQPPRTMGYYNIDGGIMRIKSRNQRFRHESSW